MKKCRKREETAKTRKKFTGNIWWGRSPDLHVCHHGFQRGSPKRLLPNSRGPERRSSFLIVVRFSSRWRSNTMRSVRCEATVRYARARLIPWYTHTLMFLIWFAHHTCSVTNSRSRTYVGRCLGPVCPHTRAALARGELLADGRDRWMSVLAFMVADRHIATMELLP